MEKFATLEPTRLYASAATTGARLLSRSHAKAPSTGLDLVGRLPADLHLLIFTHLPVPDIPSYCRCSRRTASLANQDKAWEVRWKSLGVEKHNLADVLDALEKRAQGKAAALRAAAPPTLPVDHMDDDFGDFASVNVLSPPLDEMGDFLGSFKGTSLSMSSAPPVSTFRSKYIRAHLLLKPTTSALTSPPHLILSALTPFISSSLVQQAKTLHLLSLFLSPLVQPLKSWGTMYTSLRAAIDRFDATLLAAFDHADSQGEEDKMREVAESSWQVWDGVGDWELGKVWAEKREVFYEQGRWEPLDNFKRGSELDFDAMDDFMTHILSALTEHGARAVRVFPPPSQVLTSFADRVAVEVVCEYITPLLTRAREISNEVFLKATAATFREAWRMVDVIVDLSAERSDAKILRTRAEDIVYQMFEINMDEYLDEEAESVKLSFQVICRDWAEKQASAPTDAASSARFLTSHNPAQVKRNVLASFTDILMLPVTIVPRTVGAVGAALTTGGTVAAPSTQKLHPPGFESSPYGTRSNETSRATASPKPDFNRLELLLSLDVALELIHASRDSLKRVETFAEYPGHYGQRVRDTIEEIFILMLQALNERHVSPGFNLATEQMETYNPSDHAATTTVAPLLQFFELVHIGDTMQSMIQVYFDKELAPHIDRTDFLNPVVREKKRFENALDDSVAGGLNAGTQLLMNQVEHIMLTLTKPREYYPSEDTPLDLGPTHGCTEAIQCLDTHCKLLKGSTSREVLEVFYQEVGLRLIGLLQKHIKRQIISLTGGFQVIADLNAYHNFIASLKVPAITADFSHLKMLGHVFVVEDAKDLAQIVRDVTRYGGAYRPEDIYEFIQRRSDWKKIEKTVDKTMYNLSFKEDCTIC